MHKFVPVLALIATVPIWIDVPVAAELHSAAPLSSPFGRVVVPRPVVWVVLRPADWVVVPRPAEWVVVPRPAEWVVVPRPAGWVVVPRPAGWVVVPRPAGITRSRLTTPISARLPPEDAPLSRQPRSARVRFAPVPLAPAQTGRDKVNLSRTRRRVGRGTDGC